LTHPPDLNYDLVDFHSSRPGHDLAYRMRDDLIRSLGWQRPMNLEQSLEKTVHWFLAHQKWRGGQVGLNLWRGLLRGVEFGQPRPSTRVLGTIHQQDHQ